MPNSSEVDTFRTAVALIARFVGSQSAQLQQPFAVWCGSPKIPNFKAVIPYDI